MKGRVVEGDDGVEIREGVGVLREVNVVDEVDGGVGELKWVGIEGRNSMYVEFREGVVRWGIGRLGRVKEVGRVVVRVVGRRKWEWDGKEE